MAPKSLCRTTAFTPVPTFLGGSCPLGCSLSAPATGGFSVVSPQCSCMRQAPRKRSGPGADFMGYHSTTVRILQGGGCFLDGGSCCGLRPPSAEGQAWLRRCPACPPSNVFRNRGTPPVPPAGAAPPAPCVGTEVRRSQGKRDRDPHPNLPSSTGAGTEAPRGAGDRCEARSSAVTARS